MKKAIKEQHKSELEIDNMPKGKMEKRYNSDKEIFQMKKPLK